MPAVTFPSAAWVTRSARAVGLPGDARLGRAVTSGRAAVFGTSSVCLALLAHRMAGGGRPSALMLLGTALLLTRVAYGPAGRERGVGYLAPVTVFIQTVLHLAFALSTHHGHDPETSPTAASRPDSLSGSAVAGAAPDRHAFGDHLAAVLVPDTWMVLAHVAAAVGVAALLRAADRRLWDTAALRTIVARVAALLARLAASVRAAARAVGRYLTGSSDAVTGKAGPGRPRSATSPRHSWNPTTRLFPGASYRRGPPVPRVGMSIGGPPSSAMRRSVR